MKRTPLRRRKPWHPSPRSHRDPVTPEVYARVRDRDGGCIGPRIDMPGPCFGRIEVDHVVGSGLSRRGPSTVDNLASLCGHHHRVKTEAARVWRPRIIDHIRREDAAQ